MSDEQGAIPEALERLFDQAFADGIAAGKSGDESILAGSSAVYARSALTIVAADRLTDTGDAAKDKALRLIRNLVVELETWEPDLLDVLRATPQARLMREWIGKAPTPKPPVDAGAMREAIIAGLVKAGGHPAEYAEYIRDDDRFSLGIFLTAIRNLSDDGETM